MKTTQYDEHIITEFDDKNATRLIDSQLFQLGPITTQDNYDTLSHTQWIVELNERKAFLEGVASYLGNVKATDTEAMLTEVKKKIR